ncbi:MAG: acetyl-CoA decarbonylase/synthase complex subunit delta [Candidatus Methanomethylophilaceae archaeon]|jgi:acetyl-CoA decarbonylase/synthase complex subunit delta
MTEIPAVNEKYSGEIGEIALGKGNYKAGGAKGMPFLSFENPSKRRPMIAGEVFDDISDYPKLAADMFDGREKDPVEWALMWKQLGADMICLRLVGTDPSKKNTTPEDAAALVKKISEKTDLPIMVSGCGIPEKDIETLTAISNSVKDSRLVLSKVDESDYKKLSTAAMANDHLVLAFSNLDINLAKQMNILLTDFGIQKNDIIMDPLMAALGMGLDYSYSVNERIRLAALNGDKMLQVPMICDCTSAWSVSDATNDEDPSMGDPVHRITWWEVITALSALISGADIVIIRGPGAMDMVKVYTEELTEAI